MESKKASMGFLGYPRPSGRVGIRNHVAVIATVSYANPVVKKVTRAVPGTKAVAHNEGCGRSDEDLEVTARTLVGLGSNPNVHSAVVIGLGTEAVGAEEIARRIRERGTPAESVVLQQEGGSRKALDEATTVARRLVEEASKVERREFGFEHLTLGVECGGSDALSGITANPAVGVCADWLVGQGGSVILSEITEMIGTEKILGRRAASEDVRARIDGTIKKQQQLAASVLGAFASGATISPGNVQGGITSIQEKSLGCIIKGGTTTIVDVLPYAQSVEKKGLNIMDTPGSDVFSFTAMIAGGAQIVIFTTGRGSPAGSPIAPVIKVSTNTGIHERLPDDIDVNAGQIIDGRTVDEVGQEIVDFVGEVAGGRQPHSEANGYELLAIHAYGPAGARTTAR